MLFNFSVTVGRDGNRAKNRLTVKINITQDHAIKRRFLYIDLVNDFVLQGRKYSVTFPAVAREYVFLETVSYRTAVWCSTLFGFILELMKCWEIVSSNRMITSFPFYTAEAGTLSSLFVARSVVRTTDIASTFFEKSKNLYF